MGLKYDHYASQLKKIERALEAQQARFNDFNGDVLRLNKNNNNLLTRIWIWDTIKKFKMTDEMPKWILMLILNLRGFDLISYNI